MHSPKLGWIWGNWTARRSRNRTRPLFLFPCPSGWWWQGWTARTRSCSALAVWWQQHPQTCCWRWSRCCWCWSGGRPCRGSRCRWISTGEANFDTAESSLSWRAGRRRLGSGNRLSSFSALRWTSRRWLKILAFFLESPTRLWWLLRLWWLW